MIATLIMYFHRHHRRNDSLNKSSQIIKRVSSKNSLISNINSINNRIYDRQKVVFGYILTLIILGC